MSSFEDLSLSEIREYEEWAVATAQQEFEQRKFDVQCCVCPRNECDTQQRLEAEGWLFDRSGEFCPTHNSMLQSVGRCGPQVQQLAGAH